MSFTNAQVAQRWAGQTPLRGYEKPQARSGHGSVFFEDRIIYSYRKSFPLAKLFTPASRSEGAFAIRNAERVSVTTTQHLRSLSCTGPQVPLSSLSSAGVPFVELEKENIVAWSAGETTGTLARVDGKYYTYHYQPNGSREFVEWTPPAQGMFFPGNWEDDVVIAAATSHFGVDADKVAVGYWHQLGGTLIQWKGRHYLSGLDEGMAFVIRLRRDAKPTTLEKAFEALKPGPVLLAERDGLKVKRQGEWFFIPTDYTAQFPPVRLANATSKSQLERFAVRRALPVPTAQGNRHVCKVLTFAQGKHEGNLHEVDRITGRLVKGRVVHKLPPSRWSRPAMSPKQDPHLWNWDSRGTREHRTLDLGDTWHQAWRALDDGSWSSHGRVD